MFLLLKTHVSQKMRWRRMAFLWVRESTLINKIILLMSSLIMVLQPKIHLSMNFPPTSIFFCPCVGTALNAKLSKYQWVLFFGTGSVGSLLIVSSSFDTLRLLNIFVIKCLLLSLSSIQHKTTPLYQACQCACSQFFAPKVK